MQAIFSSLWMTLSHRSHSITVGWKRIQDIDQQGEESNGRENRAVRL